MKIGQWDFVIAQPESANNGEEMRMLWFVLVLAASLLFQSHSFAIEQFSTELEAQNQCPSDIVVWLNTSTGMVHYKGERWYGHTKTGDYVCKKEISVQNNHGERTVKVVKWTALAKINAFGGGAILYINYSSIRHDSSNASMWVLMDFKNNQEIDGMKFLSSKFQKEYDCKKGKWRILISSMLDKNMGGGEVVQSDAEPDNWKTAEAGSIAKTEWDIACKKAVQ